MNPKPKAGWKTTEFWLGLVAAVWSYLMTTDLITDDTASKILGVVGAVLAYLGYAATRGVVKRERIRQGREE